MSITFTGKDKAILTIVIVEQFNFRTQLDLFSLTIEGDRIKLLAIDNKFATDIFREFTEEVTTYMIPSPPKSIEGTESFIAASRCGMEIGYNLQLVVISKATGEFLGNCGLHGENKVKTPEIGIWLKKGASGNGYGREAVRTLIDWAKENLDLDYLVYPVDRRNVPSRKIPESLGGKIIQSYRMTTPTNKILDCVVYRIDY